MNDYPYQLWGQTTDGLFAYEMHVDADPSYRVGGLSDIEMLNFSYEPPGRRR